MFGCADWSSVPCYQSSSLTSLNVGRICKACVLAGASYGLLAVSPAYLSVFDSHQPLAEALFGLHYGWLQP
jgi:hypothetical protein